MIGEQNFIRLFGTALETDFFGVGRIHHSEGISQQRVTGGGDSGHWSM